MRFSIFFLCSLAAAVGLSVVSPSRAALAPTVCTDGVVAGNWKLPTTNRGTGLVHGRLVDSTNGQTAYRVRLLLTDVPTPCLSCIQGEVHGFLYPAGGGAPAFAVKGEYGGSFFGGFGKYQLRVFHLGGAVSVGSLSGTFDDPPADGVPGVFDGDWLVCP